MGPTSRLRPATPTSNACVRRRPHHGLSASAAYSRFPCARSTPATHGRVSVSQAVNIGVQQTTAAAEGSQRCRDNI
jgi:hypothetical protein